MILFFADLRNFNLVNSRFYPFYKGFCVKKKGINEANVNFNCVYVSIGSYDAWCERDNSIRFSIHFRVADGLDIEYFEWMYSCLIYS